MSLCIASLKHCHLVLVAFLVGCVCAKGSGKCTLGNEWKSLSCLLPGGAQPSWAIGQQLSGWTLRLSEVVLSYRPSAGLHPLGSSHQAREDGLRSSEHKYLSKLSIVNQLGPVPVDQGTETKTILPTVQGERGGA